MSRLSLALALAAPLLLASACENKKAADTAPAPTAEPTPVAKAAPPSAEPAATPVAPADDPAATPAAKVAEPPAAPAGQADAGAAPGEGAKVDPASLAGHYAFGWSGGKTMKCKKVDEKMVKKLAGGQCRQRPTSEAFAEGAGAWSECEVGKATWVVFASKAICQEQLETMEANAP